MLPRMSSSAVRVRSSVSRATDSASWNCAGTVIVMSRVVVSRPLVRLGGQRRGCRGLVERRPGDDAGRRDHGRVRAAPRDLRPGLRPDLGEIDVLDDRAREPQVDGRRVIADPRHPRRLGEGDGLVLGEGTVIDAEVAQRAAEGVVRRRLRAPEEVAVGAGRVDARGNAQVRGPADLDAVLVEDAGPARPVRVALLGVGQVLPRALTQGVGHRPLHAGPRGRCRRGQAGAQAHRVGREDRAGVVAVGGAVAGRSCGRSSTAGGRRRWPDRSGCRSRRSGRSFPP